jgi:ATP-dependent RNA helicase DDX3X
MSENFNFDTADMGAALDSAEVPVAPSTIGRPKPEQNWTGAPEDKDEAEAKAKEYNWPEKIAYDYSAYQPVKNAPVDVGSMPEWASSAVRYEWSDEYGEVGPRIPQLEADLYNLEFLHRAGEAMKNLEQPVHTEGPVKINPVMKVGQSSHPT